MARHRTTMQPHYRLDGTVIDVDLRDATPKCRFTGRAGAVSGNPGRSAAGLSLDGTDDFVTFDDEAALRIGTGDAQIHMWLSHGTQVNADGYFLTKGGNNAGQFSLRLDADDAGDGDTIATFDAGVLTATAAADGYEADGEDHLISVIISGGDMRLYIDGVQKDSDTIGDGDLDATSDLVVGTIAAYGATYTWVGRAIRLIMATATKSFADAERDMGILYRRGPYSN